MNYNRWGGQINRLCALPIPCIMRTAACFVHDSKREAR